MGHTNTTTHYGLPQFISTDKAGWLTDVNEALENIDNTMFFINTTASDADTKADTASGLANSAAAQGAKAEKAANAATSAANAAASSATNAQGTANTASETAGQALQKANENAATIAQTNNNLALFKQAVKMSAPALVSSINSLLQTTLDQDKFRYAYSGGLEAAVIYGSMTSTSAIAAGVPLFNIPNLNLLSDVTFVGICEITSGSSITFPPLMIKQNGDVVITDRQLASGARLLFRGSLMVLSGAK